MIWRMQQYKEMRERTARMATTKRAGEFDDLSPKQPPANPAISGGNQHPPAPPPHGSGVPTPPADIVHPPTFIPSTPDNTRERDRDPNVRHWDFLNGPQLPPPGSKEDSAIWRRQQHKETLARLAQMKKTKRVGEPKESKAKRHDSRGADARNRLVSRKRGGDGGGEPVSKRQAKPREDAGARFMKKGGYKRNKAPPKGDFQQVSVSKANDTPRPPSPPPPPPRRNKSKKPPKKDG